MRQNLRLMKKLVITLLFLLPFLTLQAADAVKPLRILLVTGGCCHDYPAQKDILKKGLEARANVIVEHAHTPDKTTNPPLPIYGNADYGKGYDAIIHDECAAAMKDIKTVKGVLSPHRHGIPGVNLHCAMHSYRTGDHRNPTTAGTDGSLWFDYLGLQSSGHGPKEPMKIQFTDKKHPITKPLKDWTTGPEELYNNIQIFPGAKALATGIQMQKPRKKKGQKAAGEAKEANAVVAWVNDYHGARVFSTTIGHYNETVADDRYLDLVTRGLLWSCKKLNKDYLKD